MSDGVEKPRRRKAIRIEHVSAPVDALVEMGERALAADGKTFKATSEQQLARARLWMELRDGPKQAHELTTPQLAALAREPRVVEWMKRSAEFRDWFVHVRDVEERIEASYSAFIEGVEIRRATMSDKDYINCLKLMAELANKMPKKWENTKVLDADVGRMSDEERIRLMVDTLRRIGYRIDDPGPIRISGDETKAVDAARDPLYDANTVDGSGSGGEPSESTPGTTTPSPAVHSPEN